MEYVGLEDMVQELFKASNYELDTDYLRVRLQALYMNGFSEALRKQQEDGGEEES